MATYASASNPFIQPTNSTSSPSSSSSLSPSASLSSRSVCGNGKKDAPGMAKPQHSLVKPNDRVTLLMNVNSSLEENLPKRSQESSSSYQIEKSEKIDDETLTNDDALEITRACESLVEMTVKLELEEKALQIVNMEDNLAAKENDQENHSKDSPSSGSKLIEEEKEEEEEDDDDELEVECELPPPMEQDNRKHQHIELIKKLRLQLRDLEKYAYERGELEQVPPSILAERQSVIIDTLKDRLSLNISSSEIEGLELDELKKQVDKEIHDLIDPLITKEHLLSQLKTQLTDLERYITHLHGTLGRIHDKKGCLCQMHNCSRSLDENNNDNSTISMNSLSKSKIASSLINAEALPKTSRLIRSLVTQLICSDIKLRESARKEEAFEQKYDIASKKDTQKTSIENATKNGSNVITKVQHFNDEAAWSLHMDRVILATDSLVNLFTLEPRPKRSSNDKAADASLIESIVRRQLVPAIRDLLSYGINDQNSMPHSTSYASFLFDPYYLLSSLTCFPSSQKSTNSSANERVHVWNIIEDYYNCKNEPGFKTSSVKTLSQSFNLAPSISGPIKITSKQALLIAIEDIIETLSKCRPNGPESHIRSFIYTALNRKKLSTWLRLIFKNKSVIRKYYYNFAFVSQPDKMDKLLNTLDSLNQFEFVLRTDIESIEQFVSAF